MTPPEQNQLFDLLVRDQDDLEGLIAYARYKWHKREVCLEFRAKEGREWTEQERDTFMRTVSRESQLALYRSVARNSLQQFGEQVVIDAKPEIVHNAIAGRIDTLYRDILRQGSFAARIVSGILATTTTLAVSLVIVFGLKLLGIDLIEAWKSLEPDPV